MEFSFATKVELNFICWPRPVGANSPPFEVKTKILRDSLLQVLISGKLCENRLLQGMADICVHTILYAKHHLQPEHTYNPASDEDR